MLNSNFSFYSFLVPAVPLPLHLAATGIFTVKLSGVIPCAPLLLLFPLVTLTDHTHCPLRAPNPTDTPGGSPCDVFGLFGWRSPHAVAASQLGGIAVCKIEISMALLSTWWFG